MDPLIALLIGAVLGQVVLLFFMEEIFDFLDKVVRVVRKSLGLPG